jgi:hypothetical protein
MESLKPGDRVMWRGGFGSLPAEEATIEDMQVTAQPREKSGEPTECVPVALVRQNRVVFGLTNGHWCYSDQIVLDEGRGE